MRGSNPNSLANLAKGRPLAQKASVAVRINNAIYPSIWDAIRHINSQGHKVTRRGFIRWLDGEVSDSHLEKEYGITRIERVGTKYRRPPKPAPVPILNYEIEVEDGWRLQAADVNFSDDSGFERLNAICCRVVDHKHFESKQPLIDFRDMRIESKRDSDTVTLTVTIPIWNGKHDYTKVRVLDVKIIVAVAINGLPHFNAQGDFVTPVDRAAIRRILNKYEANPKNWTAETYKLTSRFVASEDYGD